MALFPRLLALRAHPDDPHVRKQFLVAIYEWLRPRCQRYGQEAEDIRQETILRVMEQWHRCRASHEGALRHWLTAIARSQAADRFEQSRPSHRRHEAVESRSCNVADPQLEARKGVALARCVNASLQNDLPPTRRSKVAARHHHLATSANGRRRDVTALLQSRILEQRSTDVARSLGITTVAARKAASRGAALVAFTAYRLAEREPDLFMRGALLEVACRHRAGRPDRSSPNAG